MEVWYRAREVRLYLAALKEAAAKHVEQEPDGRLSRWLQWAEEYAAQLDPLAEVASLPPRSRRLWAPAHRSLWVWCRCDDGFAERRGLTPTRTGGNSPRFRYPFPYRIPRRRGYPNPQHPAGTGLVQGRAPRPDTSPPGSLARGLARIARRKPRRKARRKARNRGRSGTRSRDHTSGHPGGHSSGQAARQTHLETPLLSPLRSSLGQTRRWSADGPHDGKPGGETLPKTGAKVR